MRRWLLIFLVVLLPMQLSWAAVASYCQHESGAAASSQHVGHHEHQHEASAGTADHSDKDSSATTNGAIDVDCGTCHMGCCTALVSALPVLVANGSFKLRSKPAPRVSSQPASLPERPNWADLA